MFTHPTPALFLLNKFMMQAVKIPGVDTVAFEHVSKLAVGKAGPKGASASAVVQAEHGKADLEKRIADLEARKTKQENKVIELKAKIQAIEKRNSERKEVEDKKREEELKFLKYQETHLNKFLK